MVEPDVSVDTREPHEYAYRKEKFAEYDIPDVGEPESSDNFNAMVFGPRFRKKNPHVGYGLGVGWYDKVLDIFLDTEPPQDVLLAMGEWRSEHDGDWVSVDSVVDSGAVKPVAPPSMAPGLPKRTSAGSRAGHSFSTATGAEIKNLGEQELQVVTDGGMDSTVLFRLAEVSRPLMSVSAICDHGNRVIFGRGGGVIQNLATGLEVPFERRGGIYAMVLWIRGNGNSESQKPASAFASGVRPQPGSTRP